MEFDKIVEEGALQVMNARATEMKSGFNLKELEKVLEENPIKKFLPV